MVSQLLIYQRVRLCANPLWFDLGWYRYSKGTEATWQIMRISGTIVSTNCEKIDSQI